MVQGYLLTEWNQNKYLKHRNKSEQCFDYVCHSQQATTIQPANTVSTLSSLFITRPPPGRARGQFFSKILLIFHHYSATNFYNNFEFLTTDADHRSHNRRVKKHIRVKTVKERGIDTQRPSGSLSVAVQGF